MSSENEDTKLSLPSLLGSSAPESDQKKPRIRYTRDFFLSLSGLDVCKNLPSGFDKSILSDLEEATNTVFERQRTVGNISLQGSRHGSQSLNKLENSNSWGNSVKWDTHSSVSSNREGDLQSDRDSLTQDSGRRFGNQSRRTWQHQEHDGLLGSGALAKPSGYTGASASKARGNVQYQLSRTTEPYQPPRPYKAANFSRKDGTDSCNDETFGSSECSDKDRSEEERKRRESFELMRKGQQKSLQEKQHKDIIKGNLDEDLSAESLRKGQQKILHEKHKDFITGKLDEDIVALKENSDADKITQSRSKPDESETDFLLNDFLKSSSHVHIPASRPLVPPGFASTLTEKNQQISKLKDLDLQSSDDKENSFVPSSTDVDFGNISFSSSGLQKVNEIWEEDIPNDSFHKKEEGPDRVDAVSQNHSPSIFNKLFGNILTKDFESLASDTQKPVSKADVEACSHVASVSSKFAHLFHEESEEKKSTTDKSSRDLLSLIVNKDNFSPQAYMPSSDEAAEQNRSSLSSENNVILGSAAPSTIAGMQSYQNDKQSPSCAVLTCEDLEQSILAGVKDKCSTVQSLKEPWTVVDVKSEEHSDVVDDHASQHLLSLLQIGANSKESIEPPRLDAIGSHEMHPSSDTESGLHLQNSAALSLSKTKHSSEKGLTLEALFGSAFMNELHSMEAPVSTQKTSVGRVTDEDANQLSFYPLDSLNSTSNEQPSKKDVFEEEILQLSSETEYTRAYNNSGNRAGFEDSPLQGFKLGDVAFEPAAGDINLPEEDSLISLADSLENLTYDSLHFQKSDINESLGPKNTVGSLNDKLNAILRVGESSRESAVDYPPLRHASHEMVDPDGLYRHLQIRPSSQFPHQMNNGRPLFASHMDHSTFRNSQMNFSSPDVIHHDLHHPFSSNAFAHHSYNNFSGQHLDTGAHHPMLQNMPLPGNFPSHNTVQGLPQRMNHIPEFSHELNHHHVFPLHHHRQANYGGLDMGIPGPIGGVGRPPMEIYERLIEMEMRANPKFHAAMSRPVSGMYGAEFDMNLHYR